MDDANPVRRFNTRHGLQIAADEVGRGQDRTVVFLHGGGQTRHSWGTAVSTLADAGFHAITLDLRGHGDSDWSHDGMYGTAIMVDDVVDVLTAIGRPASLVGASLGGLVAMQVAAQFPALVNALVMVDVVPHIEAEGANEIVAFMRANLDGFARVEDAADAVAAYLPHRQRPTNDDGLRKNLRLRNGRYHWHWDPRILADASTGGLIETTDEALVEFARNVTAPTLLIRGGRSRVVSKEGVEQFRKLVPHSEYMDIEHADHMVAGDANDAFNSPLVEFLRRALIATAG
jgi:pimeloyl-ACP methyl ester carboxylesterase